MSRNKRTNKFYRENEAEVMKQLGLKPTKNSGAGWIEKEDGYNDFLIAQLKSTDAQSMRVQLADWNKLEINALTSHKIPVFVLQFLATNEVFIMARPVDFKDVANFLETGVCSVNNTLVAEIAESKIINKPTIKTGDRGEFWAEKEREREEWRRQLKLKP